MTAPDVLTEAPAAPVAPALVPAAPADAAPLASPATEPITPPVTEPAPPTEERLTRREAKRGLHQDRAAAAAAAPVVEPAAPEVPGALPAAAEPALVLPSAPAGLAPTPTPMPAGIRVPIPEGHAIREMGVDSITVTSPQQERAVRAALNSYVRRQEVAVLQTQLQQAQQALVEREARETATTRWTSRPEYQAAIDRYNEIKEAFGEEAGEQYWRGVNSEFDRVAQGEYEQRMSQVRAQQAEQVAQGWKQEAWANVNTLPESLRRLPSYGQWFEDAVHSFNAEIELGHYPNLNGADDLHREFLRFFSTRLTAQPEVAGLYQAVTQREFQARTAAAARAAEQQRQLEQIRQAAIEGYKKQVADKRIQAPPHPLGNLNAVSRDRAPAGSEAAEPLAAELSPSQFKKSLRTAAREDARRRFGG